MTSSTARGGAIPSVSAIDTVLSGTPRQVSWAEDIRAEVVNAINSYAVAMTVEMEQRLESAGTGRRSAARRRENAKVELEMLPSTIRAVGDGLAKVDSAKWLIDHLRHSRLSEVSTRAEMERNMHGVRDGMLSFGENIISTLKAGGYVDDAVGSLLRWKKGSRW